jgi:acyl-coenzyme A synthetase/AMP-(fatty) acid ligase
MITSGFKAGYLDKFPGFYLEMVWLKMRARLYFITGRVDDVINVAGQPIVYR